MVVCLSVCALSLGKIDQAGGPEIFFNSVRPKHGKDIENLREVAI